MTDAATNQAVREFEGVCRSVVGRFFPPGGLDRDDLLQEARIGLVKGLRDYRPERGVPLSAFVYMAVERQVITALKTATRQKHGPLNDAVSSARDDDGNEVAMLDLLEGDVRNQPEQVLQLAEDMATLDRAVSERLTGIEAACLVGLLEGQSYEAIGEALNLGEKAVDNALQRVKRKLAPVVEAMAA